MSSGKILCSIFTYEPEAHELPSGVYAVHMSISKKMMNPIFELSRRFFEYLRKALFIRSEDKRAISKKTLKTTYSEKILSYDGEIFLILLILLS